MFANNAINRWANYDGTYWKELFTTLRSSTQVSPALVTTITTGTTTYTAPTDMREVGGFVRVNTSTGTLFQKYPIINVEEVQFRDDMSTYCYFTGNPTAGFVMHLNPAPTASLNGLTFDYVYYKKATSFTAGSSTTEMANPYFIVHHMLYPRFRASRNPYMNTALRDAEEALKNMQQDNNSGTWADPWSISDTSGTIFGEE